jgi:hypothetical protein
MANLLGLVTITDAGSPINALFGQGYKAETSEHGELSMLRANDAYRADLPSTSDYVEVLSLNVKCVNPNLPIHFTSIQLHIGGSPCVFVPFSLFQEFTTVKIVGNTRVYSFKFPLLGGKIPMSRLHFHAATIRMICPYDANIIGVTAHFRGTILDTPARNEQRNAPVRQDVFQYYETLHVNNTTNATKFRMTAHLFNLCKGYIIEGPIEQLRRVTYMLNNNRLYDHAESGLLTFGLKLNDRMLYLPFNMDEPLLSNAIGSFRGGVNHNRIDDVTIYMELSEPCAFSVHAVCANALRTQGGMGCAYFDSEEALMAGKPSAPVNPLGLSGPFPYEPTNAIRAGRAPPVVEQVWTSEHKVIDIERAMCPILYDTIAAGSEYCTCGVCNNNFTASALKHHLTTNSRKNCPMCREPWMRWVVYTNSPPAVSST